MMLYVIYRANISKNIWEMEISDFNVYGRKKTD